MPSMLHIILQVDSLHTELTVYNVSPSSCKSTYVRYVEKFDPKDFSATWDLPDLADNKFEM